MKALQMEIIRFALSVDGRMILFRKNIQILVEGQTK